MDEDIKVFLADSYENINHIERDLVTLEQEPTNQELLVRIYRSLHTIKGNCGFMGFANLEAVAHSGENLLSRLQDGQLLLDSDITSALLELVDVIQQICTQIEATGQEGEADYSALIQRLNQPQQATQKTFKKTEAEFQPTISPLFLDNNTWVYSADELLSPSATSKSVQAIRVDINLLDKLMNLVGELVLVRNQILQFSTTQDEAAFVATSQHLNQLTTELQEGVMKTRMQPISKVCSKFPRVVRDMAIACGKQVQVEMEGEETELDKTIIEAIKDPLTHLIRNCVDHGIEVPETRLAAGKPTTGSLQLQAFHESGYVNIEIADDGAGIDPERLKKKALDLGLITPERYSRLSDSEAINLIFLPGFSTAPAVTRLSGRGVGMDVVKTDIEKVGGTVDVHSQLGVGTTFKLKIPLTLAIIPALIVTSGGDRYAIPQMSLLELVRLEGEQARRSIERVHHAPVYRLRGKLLPLVYLNQELQLGTGNSPSPSTQEELLNIVVLQAGANSSFGLVVDTINDTQEIVVKPLGTLLKETPCFAGATILGDGNVALILDVLNLAQQSGVLSEEQTKEHLEQEMASQQQEDDLVMLLLFEVGNKGRMAIPLSMVLRLEEFPRAVVEQAGQQMVVQYRDEILPLLDLTIAFSPRSLATDSRKRTSIKQERTCSLLLDANPLQVVVVSCHDGRTVGLVVNRILDIAMESLTVTGAASRPGVQAIAVIQGQVTEILDVEGLCQGMLGKLQSNSLQLNKLQAKRWV
jgi:two-component system, chemotaxis family, sensor kinase CheA